MAIRANLVGKNFGRWTVLSFKKTIKSRAYWECVCSCGSIKNVSTTNLCSGWSKSCGCYRVDNSRKMLTGKISPNRKKYGESSFGRVYRNYRNSAKKRKIEFSLSKEQVKELTSKDCSYCGSKPKSIAYDNTYKRLYGNYIYNGIDRVENKIGYVIENCVTCCRICNVSKNNWSKEEFFKHVEKIYNHSIAKI
jgi:hypothetical protein